MSNADESTAESPQSLRLFTTLDDILPKVHALTISISKQPPILTLAFRLLEDRAPRSANSSASRERASSWAIESRMSLSPLSGTSTPRVAKLSNLIRCEALSRIWHALTSAGLVLLLLLVCLTRAVQIKNFWII